MVRGRRTVADLERAISSNGYIIEPDSLWSQREMSTKFYVPFLNESAENIMV